MIYTRTCEECTLVIEADGDLESQEAMNAHIASDHPDLWAKNKGLKPDKE